MRTPVASVPVLAPALALALALAACGSSGGAAGGTTTTSTTTSASTSAPASTSTTSPASTTTSAPAGTSTSTSAPATTEPDPGGGPLVVVDPGHNGANGAHPEEINRPVDAGGFQKPCNTTGTATAGGTTESSINWAVAQLVRDRLEAAGARVILTRQDDVGVGPCIDERGLTAARAGADLLVSVHADGAPASARGFHVIHPALRPGYTDDTVGPSAELAAAVRDELVAAGFDPSTYVGDGGLDQRGDLGTLNRAGVPAVMLEAGNLHHPDDAALLTSPEGQARLADALTSAILAYLG